MTEVIKPRFGKKDYAAHIKETYETGVSYVPQFLTARSLRFAQNLVEDLDPYFKNLDNGKGSNYFAVDWEKVMRGDLAKFFPTNTLSMAVSRLLGDHGEDYEALSDLSFNMPFILKYEADSVAKPHRDHREFEAIGVTISVSGEADFGVHRKKDEPPFASWRVRPGDAVFLRMTGFNPAVPWREEIFHSVTPPATEEQRVSIVLRQAPIQLITLRK